MATKQPAFTASAVAVPWIPREILINRICITSHHGGRVSRSQIASFIGNLLIVFPGAFMLAWLYDLVTKTKMLDNQRRWIPCKASIWHSLSCLRVIRGIFISKRDNRGLRSK